MLYAWFYEWMEKKKSSFKTLSNIVLHVDNYSRFNCNFFSLCKFADLITGDKLLYVKRKIIFIMRIKKTPFWKMMCRDCWDSTENIFIRVNGISLFTRLSSSLYRIRITVIFWHIGYVNDNSSTLWTESRMNASNFWYSMCSKLSYICYAKTISKDFDHWWVQRNSADLWVVEHNFFFLMWAFAFSNWSTRFLFGWLSWMNDNIHWGVVLWRFFIRIIVSCMYVWIF